MATEHAKRTKETKDEKFVRLAERRVNLVLERLSMLGQLADRKNYAYTDAQVAKIFRAIESEVRATKSRFKEGGTNRKRFTL